MSWRDQAAPIVRRVLADTAGQPEPVVRQALTDAYPFGPRQFHPYKVWCDEIARQRGKKPPLGSRQAAPVLRPLATDLATELRVLAAVTAHWSSTPEVACRAVRGRESLATAGILTALEQRGLVEARRPPKGHMQWRLTERGAAEPRDLPAEVAASRRGE